MAERLRGRAWMGIRKRVLSIEPRCVECLEAGVLPIRAATEVDHIKALKDGGSNDLANLRGLCADHHAAKTRSDRGLATKRRYGSDGWPED